METTVSRVLYPYYREGRDFKTMEYTNPVTTTTPSIIRIVGRRTPGV